MMLMMLYYQTKFGCKLTSTLEDTTEIVIFWWYKPSWWPWHWTQWTNFSAWHFSLWCCITIPGLATKCSVAHKTLSEKTFTNILNLRCDLEHSNPTFQQDTLAYDAVPSNQVCLQIDQQFKDTVKIIICWLYKPSLWPWKWRCEANFSHDTSPCDNTPPYQIWLKKKVERFWRYWVDMIGHTDRTTDGQSDSNTPPPPIHGHSKWVKLNDRHLPRL